MGWLPHFRHTCASLLFQRGWNAVQVQLERYVHLMDDLGSGLDVGAE
jgi:integrase